MNSPQSLTKEHTVIYIPLSPVINDERRRKRRERETNPKSSFYWVYGFIGVLVFVVLMIGYMHTFNNDAVTVNTVSRNILAQRTGRGGGTRRTTRGARQRVPAPGPGSKPTSRTAGKRLTEAQKEQKAKDAAAAAAQRVAKREHSEYSPGPGFMCVYTTGNAQCGESPYSCREGYACIFQEFVKPKGSLTDPTASDTGDFLGKATQSRWESEISRVQRAEPVTESERDAVKASQAQREWNAKEKKITDEAEKRQSDMREFQKTEGYRKVAAEQREADAKNRLAAAKRTSDWNDGVAIKKAAGQPIPSRNRLREQEQADAARKPNTKIVAPAKPQGPPQRPAAGGRLPERTGGIKIVSQRQAAPRTTRRK